jgi:uncharacterized repeat protein (TIGR03803 family)
MLRLRIPSALKVTLASIILIANGWAATEHVLWNFVGNPEGETPQSNLIADAAGNLYGTTVYGGLHNQGAVFELMPQVNGYWSETVLYSFPGGESGSSPAAGLVMDAAGNLYGTTQGGGNAGGSCGLGGCGTVFELSPAGDGAWQYKFLHAFQYTDGVDSTTPLILDTAGNLYGTTFSGGGCCGTVFEVSRDAKGDWSETVLYSFPCDSGCLQGGNPSSKLIFDGAGNLYGTLQGGYYGKGAVFELSPSSNGQWTETTLHSFCSDYPSCPDGSDPNGGLVFDQAGSLYGTAGGGGTASEKGGYGVVFKLTPGTGGTWSESVLFTFPGGNGGVGPDGGVVFDAQGNLYGTTLLGGKGQLCNGGGCGTVFELSPSARGWTETVVHNFRGGSDGVRPSTGVIIDSDGNLYGTVATSGEPLQFNWGGIVFKLTPSSGGWQETVYNFWTRDGEYPTGGLITDGNRNLFGTTVLGGIYGYGTVFELSVVSGGGLRHTILYNFKGGTDGNGPESPLIFDKAGNLYGVTYYGGSTGNDDGTVFELSPGSDGKWTESILHVFQGTDGFYPVGSLVIDTSGNLYGVTSAGGPGCCGTVFELSPSPGGVWTENILHSFTQANGDGGSPQAGVIMDSSGNLYGTTQAGGNPGNGGYGFGTVFELSPGSGGLWTEKLLYTFTGGSDGAFPYAAPTLDSAGNIYSTTSAGGSQECSGGCGVVFELSPEAGGSWEESVIDELDSAIANPETPVVFDAHGNLFGTSFPQNGSAYGAVFKLVPTGGGKWKETITFSFNGGRVGAYPGGPLLLDAAGNMYGVTNIGGPAEGGLVFELAP